MRRTQWFSVFALMCGILAGDAHADFPYINSTLKKRQVTIRKAVVLPAEVAYKRVSLKGVVGGAEESDQIAGAFYFVVTRELAARGVEVLPNPLESAKTDADKYAIADLQTRYDTLRMPLRKKPGRVEHGRITLDDRVAAFTPGIGSDALVFIRADGASMYRIGSLRPDSFRAEVTFVDAKTGDVLALVRFELIRDAAKKSEERLMNGLRDAMHDVPLPNPPTKK